MVSGIFTGNPSTKKIEVYYFHFTRRCMTCTNVEKASNEAVDHQYAEKVKPAKSPLKVSTLMKKKERIYR